MLPDSSPSTSTPCPISHNDSRNRWVCDVCGASWITLDRANNICPRRAVITETPPEIKLPEIKLLDQGYIRFIDHMGSDLSIARAARVSHNADWRTGENHNNDAKLIRYLWNHRHTSPFESVTFTFEVKAPIMVFRQWHRHRTQSYNELSARYSVLPDEFYLPTPETVGVQATHDKQARSLSDEPITEAERVRLEDQIEVLAYHSRKSFELYHSLLAHGWPRELARMPLGVNTYSRMFATTNLLNWFRFMSLRSESGAQYEIRVYSDAIADLIRPYVPVALAAFENNEGVAL